MLLAVAAVHPTVRLWKTVCRYHDQERSTERITIAKTTKEQACSILLLKKGCYRANGMAMLLRTTGSMRLAKGES